MLKSRTSWKIKDAAKSFRPIVSRRHSLLLLVSCCLLFVTTACRRDMQDQPRYEVYEHSDFFSNGLSSRPLVEGTVPRGYLRDDVQLYTGKKPTGAVSKGVVSSYDAFQGTGGNNGGNTSANQGMRTANASGADNNGGGVAAASTQATTTTTAQQGTYDPSYADTFPFPVTQDVLNRGQERYQIFCSMCHGAEGKGDGMVVRRGYRQPPSYHTAQLRSAPVGHFFDVITNGWGAMPNYAAQIPVRDRWAIVAYIRALQVSRQGTPADLPAQPSSGTVPPEHGPAAAGGGEHK